MNEDIFSGIDPIDASVVQFGAKLLRDSKTFTPETAKYTIESVFAPKVPKPTGLIRIMDERVCLNRAGEMIHFEKFKTYPIGSPHGVNDLVLTSKEVSFLEKRGFCEVISAL